MFIQPDLACCADPAPAPDKDDTSEQIPLHLEGLAPGHADRQLRGVSSGAEEGEGGLPPSQWPLASTRSALPDEFALPTSLTALPVLLRLPQRWQLLNGIGIAGTRWRRPNQNRHLLSARRGGGVWLADRTDLNFSEIMRAEKG